MEAPKIPSMFGFKSKKPDSFYFEPRYYSEQKEKMKSRYERINREVNKDPSFKKSSAENFKSAIRENWGENYNRTRAGNKINNKVIFYVLILSGLAYYILFL
jgi:hypothetical protein